MIVNPVAGAGRTARKWPKIKGLLKDFGLRFEDDFTEAQGHAIELAKSAAEKGYKLVVAVGGDGTVNEIVNGLYQAGSIGDVTLGIISTGTGSDYIRTVGVPRYYKEACRCLMKPRRLIVDLGIAEYVSNGSVVKRVFVNFAGAGFDAEVVKATTQRYKALGSIPSYLMGVLTTFFLYGNREVSLKLDDTVSSSKICTIVMSHGRYGGGGMLVAPDADPTDGFLDIMIIGDISKPDLLWSLPRVYRGTHLTHPKVTTKRAREIEIRSNQPLSFQADGELLGRPPLAFMCFPAC